MFKKLVIFLMALSASLSAEVKVLAFAGSTRADSYNKKLVRQAAEMAKEMGATVTIIDLKDYSMPFYDADLESKSGMPEKAKALRKLMEQSNAIMIASPEYNGSLSGALKNALDWASRGEDGGSSRTAFKDKRFAIMSTSLGKGGGARGLVHLQQVIENVGGTVVEMKVAVPSAAENIDNPEAEYKKALKQEMKELLKP